MEKVLKKLGYLSFKKSKRKPLTEEQETIVELKFNSHCDHCCKQVEKCIKEAKGVVNVDVDVEKSLGTVEGNFDVEKLKKHIFKKLKKRVEIVNQAFPTRGESESDEDDDDDHHENNEVGDHHENNEDDIQNEELA